MTGASSPQSVLEHVGPGADIIVPLANGEPVSLLPSPPELAASADVSFGGSSGVGG
jgi:hypothetical protein